MNLADPEKLHDTSAYSDDALRSALERHIGYVVELTKERDTLRTQISTAEAENASLRAQLSVAATALAAAEAERDGWRKLAEGHERGAVSQSQEILTLHTELRRLKGPAPMIDPKPTVENAERARSLCEDGRGLRASDAEWLADEFAASDAIARRRAIEEAAMLCQLRADPQSQRCAELIRAILRALPDEKVKRAPCERCGGARIVYDAQFAGSPCPGCSPPADGGG